MWRLYRALTDRFVLDRTSASPIVSTDVLLTAGIDAFQPMGIVALLLLGIDASAPLGTVQVPPVVADGLPTTGIGSTELSGTVVLMLRDVGT